MGPSQKGCAGTLLHCQLSVCRTLKVAYPGQYRSAPALSSNKERKTVLLRWSCCKCWITVGLTGKACSFSGACLSQSTGGDDQVVVVEWLCGWRAWCLCAGFVISLWSTVKLRACSGCIPSLIFLGLGPGEPVCRCPPGSVIGCCVFLFVQKFGRLADSPASGRLSPSGWLFLFSHLLELPAHKLLKAKFSGWRAPSRTSSAACHMDTGPGIYWRWQQAGRRNIWATAIFLPVVPAHPEASQNEHFEEKQWWKKAMVAGRHTMGFELLSSPALLWWDLGSGLPDSSTSAAHRRGKPEMGLPAVTLVNSPDSHA